MRVMAGAAVVLMAVAGCGPGSTGGSGGDPLRGRTFLSESVSADGLTRELVAGTRIVMEFTGDGRLVASAGCNTIAADVSITDTRLEPADLESTLIGCDQPLHEQDQWLIDFLQSGPGWGLTGDRLTLTAGATELVLLDREVADPDRPLAGTRWLVDTVVVGEVAGSAAGGEQGAWLLIEDDGSFTASSGCRDFSGQVTIAGDRLVFGEVVQTDPACAPDLADLDEVMTRVFGGEVTFTIEAARLRLDHPDGVGLGLHDLETRDLGETGVGIGHFGPGFA